MAATSVCETRSVTLQLQPSLRRYRVTYRVDMVSPTAGPIQVIQALNKQLFVSTYVYGGIDADPFAWLVEIGVPRRAGGDKLRDRWLVDCIYEFDQSQRPEFLGVTVEPFYVQESLPISRAEYAGAFEDNNGELSPLPDLSQSFTIGSRYPISNSARVPILPVPEQPFLRKALRVKFFKDSAVTVSTGPGNFTGLVLDITDTYVNAFGSSDFVLTGWQAMIVGNAVVPYVTYQDVLFKGGYQLSDVQVSPVIFYGRQWFEHTLQFTRGSMTVDELDRGLTARADDQDPDGRGGVYSGSQSVVGEPAMRSILDPDGNPVTDPVLLDGRGQPRTGSEIQKPVYLRWKVATAVDFNDLGIPPFPTA